MALLFTEGFDAYATGELMIPSRLSSRWNNLSDVSGIIIQDQSPHNHGNSILVNAVTGDNSVARLVYDQHHSIAGNLQSGIIGFHFRTDDVTNTTTRPILALMHIDVTSAQTTLRHTNNGILTVYRANTILLGSGGLISSDTWHHIEVKYYIGTSIPADSFIVRLDGSEIINLAGGTNTDNFADGECAAFQFQGADDQNRNWDNVYLLSISGAPNSDFIGPCFIETVFPTGDGIQNNFTGSDGDQIDNYVQVDDPVADDDATYNEASASGNIDVYKFANPTGNVGTIRGISLVSRARKTTTAKTLWRNVAKVSGTDYVQEQLPLQTSYDYFDDPLGTNPNTGGPWTINHFTENEFGVKLEK